MSRKRVKCFSITANDRVRPTWKHDASAVLVLAFHPVSDTVFCLVRSLSCASISLCLWVQTLDQGKAPLLTSLHLRLCSCLLGRALSQGRICRDDSDPHPQTVQRSHRRSCAL